MPVDERARHQLYRKLAEVLGPEEAGTLMNHLPPTGFGDLATKADLDALRVTTKADLDALRVDMAGRVEALEHRLTARMERLGRQLVIWTSSMVLATGALAFAAGRFA